MSFESTVQCLQSAAEETKEKGFDHKITEGVLGILNKVKKANGKVFHIEKQHWVALEKVDGRENTVYYDDMVMMNLSNYEGASHILQLLQDMSQSAFDEVFHGKGSAASLKKMPSKIR